MKISNCMIYGERKQAPKDFSFRFYSKLECGPQEINSREICLHYFDIFREFE